MQHILCGQVAEWFNAPASKTGGAQALQSSNLCLSAIYNPKAWTQKQRLSP